MIYITQLIFVKAGKENIFLEFEDFAIPLMKKYNGHMLYRLRPSKEAFNSTEKELPYEIHIISFNTHKDVTNFMNDESRLKFIHLKNESVKSTLIIKGEKL